MELLIVTGMSGAGKSSAANALEDIGYYCVDNIPPAIIPSFIELSSRSGDILKKIAIVTDMRGGTLFAEIDEVLNNIKNNGIEFKILFLDASDESLIRRYKENRRKHPLSTDKNISVASAVAKERELLNNIRNMADYIVDTTHISFAQLKIKLASVFSDTISGTMKIQCNSFGFKYGINSESDLVFDVRCLPNPFYDEVLKKKTGLEKEVQDYVLSNNESKEFLAKISDFISYAVPMYEKEGKSLLVISFGCTGGKHRSVTFAERIGKQLTDAGFDCFINHRDINKL